MYYTEKIKVVIATRLTEQEFPTQSETAKSIIELGFPNIHMHVAFENKLSLSTVYNHIINASKDDPAILMFIHDDVILLDYFWPLRIIESLKKYDIIGVAGSKVREPYKGAWGHKQVNGDYVISPIEDISGIVRHGKSFNESKLTYFGELDSEVKLLDGVLLAAHSTTLHRANVQFDPRFDFNFYDLDFCRSAEQANLRMGTCPLAIQHTGLGQYLTDNWKDNYSKYIDKWKE